jgi:hypothetical protein
MSISKLSSDINNQLKIKKKCTSCNAEYTIPINYSFSVITPSDDVGSDYSKVCHQFSLKEAIRSTEEYLQTHLTHGENLKNIGVVCPKCRTICIECSSFHFKNGIKSYFVNKLVHIDCSDSDLNLGMTIYALEEELVDSIFIDCLLNKNGVLYGLKGTSFCVNYSYIVPKTAWYMEYQGQSSVYGKFNTGYGLFDYHMKDFKKRILDCAGRADLKAFEEIRKRIFPFQGQNFF